ncbi:MAG: DUF547 domain-containing protein [Flavobacteriales bacterium]|nr:DUF547 domain-containing protein [Flavobacteriales bacterium]
MPNSAAELAEQLLLAVRKGGSYNKLIDALYHITEEQLAHDLPAERLKRAFWLNLYNAFGQILLLAHPVDLRSPWPRLAHYTARRIQLAGQRLSLNDLEHGMLRRSKLWWSKGYLSKCIPNGFEQRFRVPVDPRIHFALNCGAAGCPPIAFYEADKLDAQLDMATRSFLADHVVYDPVADTVHVTALFNWYRGDFGGRSGVLRFLKRYDAIAMDVEPCIRYSPYDWSVSLQNYSAQ